MSTPSFEKLLLEAVDEGLSSLGDSAKEAIYFYMKKNFKIDRRDIPHRIEEFTDAIEKLFGEGAKVLEILIMKHLYQKIGGIVKYPQQQKDLAFTKYITVARQTFFEEKDVRLSVSR